MPAPSENLLLRPTIHTLQVELEPAHNAFMSLVLLANAEDWTGCSDWVIQTHLTMTPEERQTNRLVTIGLYFSIVPQENWSSFPAYLAYLESLSGESMRDRMMERYGAHPPSKDEGKTSNTSLQGEINLSHILATPENYLAFLGRCFDDSAIDEALEREAYTYVTNPTAMKGLIVNHLHHMWQKYLAAEWERVRPVIQDSVNAFRQVDLANMEALAAALFITGHELGDEKWAAMLEKAERTVFVPSVHIGPYLWRWGQEDKQYILFGARLPAGATFEAPDLSRAEIIVRLNALADDSRLRILRLVAEDGELRAQDLIPMLDLSQSAVSRHLQQLTATGYLTERRCEGGKCYQLNPERIRDTFQAVETFLKVNPQKN